METYPSAWLLQELLLVPAVFFILKSFVAVEKASLSMKGYTPLHGLCYSSVRGKDNTVILYYPWSGAILLFF